MRAMEMTRRKGTWSGLLLAAALVGASSCSQEPERKPAGVKGVKAEPVEIAGKASGFTLRGTLYPPKEAKAGEKAPAVILLPMMDHDDSTWSEVAGRLAASGVWALAYDAPGHGKSVNDLAGKKKGTWQDFKDDKEFWKNFYADMPAVKEFLAGKGADARNLAVCGASVGANQAIAMCAGDEDVRAAAALSPGQDYRGIETYGPAERIAKPFFLAHSKKDDDAEAGPKINGLVKTKAEDRVYKEYPGSDHGTDLFQTDPKLAGELADWVARQLRKPAAK